MTPARVVGSNLRRLRDREGITQEEVSLRAEVHRTQISVYEGGHRLPGTLVVVKLAASLSATPDDLLAGLSWTPGSYEHGRFVIGEGDLLKGGRPSPIPKTGPLP
ncbi:MAG TPA: helix-turn-helix transcriptional regulator [Solirubrobacterales bacterium]|nr:helix-turn-helix transcriptional regulator [Solirubrobacterales bacterium]